MKIFYGGAFLNKAELLKEGIEHPIKLEYYKIISKPNETNENNIKYGIDVIKTEYLSEKTEIEKATIENISDDENLIEKMLNLFKENTVTPITAMDVVDDFCKN